MFNLWISLSVVIGYIAIAMENRIKINKGAVALLTAVICWLLVFLKSYPQHTANLQHLDQHLSDISQVLFFLIGSMAVIELIDVYKGFTIITDFIQTKDSRVLLWAVSWVTFVISSFLANMTVAMIMISLLRRLIPDREQRLIFVSLVVVASNAGGAWTPIGDTTTMMLWVGGQVTTMTILKKVFLPSVVCLLVPLTYFSWTIKKGSLVQSVVNVAEPFEKGRKRVFYFGIGTMVAVPFLTAMTTIPPYMGMLLSLSIMWLLTDMIHQERHFLKIPHILAKIDMSSVFFFMGILLMVAGLETAGVLHSLSITMEYYLKTKVVITFMMGIISAIVDNVPITAAIMGMYSLKSYVVDSPLWIMTAYCVGTGGSILIIGSASGIVAMAMEKIDFMWYLRKMSLPILIGYWAGFLLIR